MTTTKRQTVRAMVEIDLAIPGAAPEGLDVDDATWDAVENAVFCVWEAGDPENELGAGMQLKSVQMLEDR